VLRRLGGQEEERRAILAGREVIAYTLAVDLATKLRERGGGATLDRLARELRLEARVVEYVSVQLVRAGLAVRVRRRTGVTVKLIVRPR
jgi:hypothetical protein